MKKLNIILLSLVLVLTSVTNNLCTLYAKDTLNLNYKKMTMYINEKRKLSINSNALLIKWTTSNSKVATVSRYGTVKAKKTGKAVITATIKNKKYKCTVKVMKKSKINSKLYDINAWVVEDVWNNGFCDIKWYIECGTDSCGRPMDLDESLDLLDDALSSRASYNSFILSLNGKKYKKIKKYWKLLNKQILKLQDRIYDEGVGYGDTALNTKYFVIYSGKFSDAIYKL